MGQADTASLIGVSESTVWNWEHGTRPKVTVLPKIIEFLGYAPTPRGSSPIESLRSRMTTLGLTQERLAQLLQLDESTVNGWFASRHKPSRKNIERIKFFLSDNASENPAAESPD